MGKLPSIFLVTNTVGPSSNTIWLFETADHYVLVGLRQPRHFLESSSGDHDLDVLAGRRLENPLPQCQTV